MPEISTYYLVDHSVNHGRCGGISDPAWRPAKYDRWINRFAQGIGLDGVLVPDLASFRLVPRPATEPAHTLLESA